MNETFTKAVMVIGWAGTVLLSTLKLLGLIGSWTYAFLPLLVCIIYAIIVVFVAYRYGNKKHGNEEGQDEGKN